MSGGRSSHRGASPAQRDCTDAGTGPAAILRRPSGCEKHGNGAGAQIDNGVRQGSDDRPSLVDGHDDHRIRVAGLDENRGRGQGFEPRVHAATRRKARSGHPESNRALAGNRVRGGVWEPSRFDAPRPPFKEARSEQRVRLDCGEGRPHDDPGPLE